VGCFSFFANKNMTTGEGGMLTTNSDELMEKFRLLRSHGMTSLTLDRHRGRAFSYDVIELGYNYRLDEMRSALGLVQLEKLHEWNEKRRNLVCKYRSLLQNIPHIRLPFEAINVTDSACHIMPILLDEDINRQRVMSSLRERGVQTSIHYPAIHTFSYYRDLYPIMSLPISEGIAAQELTLPLFPTMEEEQVENVVNALRASVEFENASMSNFVSG
jgi:dTDP-4-amino-4,6-dideoxygalactose transaminase